MPLPDLLQTGKEKFFDLIYRGATAFPYSSDMMHVGMIGIFPFLAGKYGAEIVGKNIPWFQNHSTAVGITTSALAEATWQFMIEPRSPYDHSGDIASDIKGVAETFVGTGLGYLITRLV